MREKIKEKVFTMRISEKNQKLLQERAEIENVSMTEIVERALQSYYPETVNETEILKELNLMLDKPENLSIRDWLRFRSLLSQILYKRTTGENIVIEYQEYDGISE